MSQPPLTDFCGDGDGPTTLVTVVVRQAFYVSEKFRLRFDDNGVNHECLDEMAKPLAEVTAKAIQDALDAHGITATVEHEELETEVIEVK